MRNRYIVLIEYSFSLLIRFEYLFSTSKVGSNKEIIRVVDSALSIKLNKGFVTAPFMRKKKEKTRDSKNNPLLRKYMYLYRIGYGINDRLNG